MKGIVAKCNYCGLQYGGEKGMQLEIPSINGRTKPFECMCGAVYDQKIGAFVKR